jgi:hypothetical protein
VNARPLLFRLRDAADTRTASAVAIALLIGEAVLCGLIIFKVPCEFSRFVPHGWEPASATFSRTWFVTSAIHALVSSAWVDADTEIDWVAYMEQSETFLQVGLASYSRLLQTWRCSPICRRRCRLSIAIVDCFAYISGSVRQLMQVSTRSSIRRSLIRP